jgi:Mg-chelatase subunit ChlD
MIVRRWAFWRRVQYGAGFTVLAALVATPIYFLYFVHEPTCFDGMMNGLERGIDCGGACQLVCAADVIPLTAVWAESFKIVEGQYNAVAYVENRNTDVGSPALSYTFRLYDDAGLITERSGTTVLPPNGIYPIFEGRVQTGDRVPTRTTIEFGTDTEWREGEVGRDQFVLAERELVGADSQPRLIAQLTNNSLDIAKDVEVVAVIFNSQKQPLTASRTFLEEFPGRSTQEVVLTWPEPIAKTVRSCEVPTDVLLAIDLSGSMNDDGGDPPQPVTSVLRSAQSFVSRLKAQDQIGIVTYATEAELRQSLTNGISAVAAFVGGLTIDPASEHGSTNTGDALARMTEELASARHNEDARKVGIILTDGLATSPGNDPEAYALEKATALKAEGVELYAIGLGESVNKIFLESIATDQAHTFIAPSASEIEGIYQTITSALCEDGPSVIDVIPKPKTSFK